jgi:rod shape-determining protein MreC
VGGLALLSLVLITISFRSTALDPVEGYGASALRPFEVAANRISHPFRDAAGWATDLAHAKSENERLKHEVAVLRRHQSEWQIALSENADLRKKLGYRDSRRFPSDFESVSARVLTNPSATFDQTITIAAGAKDGISAYDVVVTEDGLVGQVTKVFNSITKVQLITDPDSAVRAVDAAHITTLGILEHGSGSGSLLLDRVTKDKQVEVGDRIVTAGSPGADQLPSLYPRGISIGTVTSVGQNDTDLFKQIQVQPFVDLTSLESVLVLIPRVPPGR